MFLSIQDRRMSGRMHEIAAAAQALVAATSWVPELAGSCPSRMRGQVPESCALALRVQPAALLPFGSHTLHPKINHLPRCSLLKSRPRINEKPDTRLSRETTLRRPGRGTRSKQQTEKSRVSPTTKSSQSASWRNRSMHTCLPVEPGRHGNERMDCPLRPV